MEAQQPSQPLEQEQRQHRRERSVQPQRSTAQLSVALGVWLGLSLVTVRSLVWVANCIASDISTYRAARAPVPPRSTVPDSQVLDQLLASELRALIARIAKQDSASAALKVAQGSTWKTLEALEAGVQDGDAQLRALKNRLAQCSSDGGTLTATIHRAEAGQNEIRSTQDELLQRTAALLARVHDFAHATEAATARIKGEADAIAEQHSSGAEAAVSQLEAVSAAHANKVRELSAAAERVAATMEAAADVKDFDAAMDGAVPKPLAPDEEAAAAAALASRMKAWADEAVTAAVTAAAARDAAAAAAALSPPPLIKDCATMDEVRAVLERIAGAAAGATAADTAVDYASVLNGARVLAASCSWTAAAAAARGWRRGVLALRDLYYGAAGWAAAGGPQEALTADTTLGRCWSMAGHEGFLTVQLAAPVTITAVSLEHVPQSVTDDPRSAPRSFRVIGHRLGTSAQQITADPTHGDVVAEGVYSITAPRARQHYTATSSGPYWAVTLEVLSNHGAPNFTCIYKLGVAGEPVEQ